jgi:hypothetical protein
MPSPEQHWSSNKKLTCECFASTGSAKSSSEISQFCGFLRMAIDQGGGAVAEWLAVLLHEEAWRTSSRAWI